MTSKLAISVWPHLAASERRRHSFYGISLNWWEEPSQAWPGEASFLQESVELFEDRYFWRHILDPLLASAPKKGPLQHCNNIKKLKQTRKSCLYTPYFSRISWSLFIVLREMVREGCVKNVVFSSQTRTLQIYTLSIVTVFRFVFNLLTPPCGNVGLPRGINPAQCFLAGLFRVSGYFFHLLSIFSVYFWKYKTLQVYSAFHVLWRQFFMCNKMIWVRIITP